MPPKFAKGDVSLAMKRKVEEALLDDIDDDLDAFFANVKQHPQKSDISADVTKQTLVSSVSKLPPVLSATQLHLLFHKPSLNSRSMAYSATSNHIDSLIMSCDHIWQGILTDDTQLLKALKNGIFKRWGERRRKSEIPTAIVDVLYAKAFLMVTPAFESPAVPATLSLGRRLDLINEIIDNLNFILCAGLTSWKPSFQTTSLILRHRFGASPDLLLPVDSYACSSGGHDKGMEGCSPESSNAGKSNDLFIATRVQVCESTLALANWMCVIGYSYSSRESVDTADGFNGKFKMKNKDEIVSRGLIDTLRCLLLLSVDASINSDVSLLLCHHETLRACLHFVQFMTLPQRPTASAREEIPSPITAAEPTTTAGVSCRQEDDGGVGKEEKREINLLQQMATALIQSHDLSITSLSHMAATLTGYSDDEPASLSRPPSQSSIAAANNRVDSKDRRSSELTQVASGVSGVEQDHFAVFFCSKILSTLVCPILFSRYEANVDAMMYGDVGDDGRNPLAGPQCDNDKMGWDDHATLSVPANFARMLQLFSRQRWLDLFGFGEHESGIDDADVISMLEALLVFTHLLHSLLSGCVVQTAATAAPQPLQWETKDRKGDDIGINGGTSMSHMAPLTHKSSSAWVWTSTDCDSLDHACFKLKKVLSNVRTNSRPKAKLLSEVCQVLDMALARVENKKRKNATL